MKAPTRKKQKSNIGVVDIVGWFFFLRFFFFNFFALHFFFF